MAKPKRLAWSVAVNPRRRVGKRDVTGGKRVRKRDRGHAVASASTLNLGEPGCFGGQHQGAFTHRGPDTPPLAADANQYPGRVVTTGLKFPIYAEVNFPS